MAVASASEFWETVEKSGLLSRHRTGELRDSYGAEPDPKAIARKLLKDNVLSRWQIQQLLLGRFTLSFGKYKLLDQIHVDRTGRVFIAEHVQLSRQVIIKTLSRNYANSHADVLQQFLKDAQNLASLDHRNIVHVFDVDSQDQRYFLVMEYISGRDLQELVDAQGPLPCDQVARYLSQTAAGLAYAHQRNMFHGDVRPGNCMVDSQDNVKLLNLGVHRLIDAEPSDEVVVDSEPTGFADYLAPEQDLGQGASDPRSDLYALGCVMYFLLTGQRPFSEGTDEDRHAAHATQTPRSILELRPDAASALVAICQRLMAKNAADRFQAAGEVKTALDGWLAFDDGTSSECSATPPPPAESQQAFWEAAQRTGAPADKAVPASPTAEVSAAGVEDSFAASSTAAPTAGGEPAVVEDEPWATLPQAVASSPDSGGFFDFLSDSEPAPHPNPAAAAPSTTVPIKPAAGQPAPKAATPTPKPKPAPAKQAAPKAVTPTLKTEPVPAEPLAATPVEAAVEEEPWGAMPQPAGAPADLGGALDFLNAVESTPVQKPAVATSGKAPPIKKAAGKAAPAKQAAPKAVTPTPKTTPTPTPKTEPVPAESLAAKPVEAAVEEEPWAAMPQPAGAPADSGGALDFLNAVESTPVQKPAATTSGKAPPIKKAAGKPAPAPAKQPVSKAAAPAPKPEPVAAEPVAPTEATGVAESASDGSGFGDFASPSDLRPKRKTGKPGARKAAAKKDLPEAAQAVAGGKVPLSRKTLLMIGGVVLGGGLLLTIGLIVAVWLVFGAFKKEVVQLDQFIAEEEVTAAANESPPDADKTEPNTLTGDTETTTEKDATDDSQTLATKKPDKAVADKPADTSARKPVKTADEPAAPATKEAPTQEESAAPAMEMAASKPAPTEEPKPQPPAEPKPTPPAEPPPPTPPAKKPFDDFAAVVALPPLDSTDPKDLGTVNTTDDKPCSLSLLGGATVLKGQIFSLQPTAAKRWDVTLRKGEEGAETKVASLGLTGTSRLAFRWEPDGKSMAGANQFQNCALSLQAPDAEPKIVALREPLTEDALNLDLDKPLVKLEWKLDALPDPSLMKIEISAPQGVKYVIEPVGPISADTKGGTTVRLEEAGELFGFKIDTKVTRRAAPQPSVLLVTATPFFKLQAEGKPGPLPPRGKFSQLGESWMQLDKRLDLQATRIKDQAKPAPAAQKMFLEDQVQGLERQQVWIKESLEKLQKSQLSLGAMGGKMRVHLRVYVQADTSEVEILKAVR
ncbi:MAG: protein kinase [Planctomycetota bacterium]|nr:protein kinase [Planctomycetota bacterium]